jgi:hypothetical protein
MVQSHNGRGDIVAAPLQLGDFLPERREVILNGQRYSAWVTTNQRYPRSILARLDRAARVYNRAIEPLISSNVEGPSLPSVVDSINNYVRANPKAKLSEQPLLDLLGQLLPAANRLAGVYSDEDRIRAIEEQPEAWNRYLVQCASLLIPNLPETELDLVPTEQLERLLRELGYLPAEDEQGEAVTPEEESPLTGDSSQQTSPDSTQDTTKISS